jgi:hypothetical protein
MTGEHRGERSKEERGAEKRAEQIGGDGVDREEQSRKQRRA